METNTAIAPHFYSADTVPPAQLWIGDHETLIAHVHEFAQYFLCPHNACKVCSVCMRIRRQQHHSLMWLAPDKMYTLEQFDDVFSKIALTLEDSEHFFFVIQNASALTNACANRLLKIIEEPPTGYHFIFLTGRKDTIPATILSRCIIHTFASEFYTTNNPLLAFFTTDYQASVQFSAVLDKTKITEQETAPLLDHIIHYWREQYKNSDNPTKKELCGAILANIRRAYFRLPMPGSAQLFWRSLYATFPR